MNFISLTRHLLLKDIRHQRLWLAVVWVFALVLPFLIRNQHLVDGQGVMLTMLATGGFFLLVALVLARVIHLDAPGREFHFLATRPVPPGLLLAGKVLFITLFLLLPIWVVQLALLYLMKIPVNGLDVILIIIETTISALAFLGAVMVLSLFIRKLPALFAWMIAAGIIVGIAAALLQACWYLSSAPWRLDFRIVNSRYLVFYMGIATTACVVAFFRYRTKSRGYAPAALAGGLALSVLAWVFWPWDLSRPFAELPRPLHEVASPLRDQISLTLTGTEGRGINIVETMGELNGKTYNTIQRETSLKGVQPPYYATLVDYHAVATLKSGRTIRSAYSDTNAHGTVGGYGDTLRQEVAGLHLLKKPAWNEGAFEVFNYPREDYASEDLTGVNIKGTLRLEIRKAVLVKTIPFKAGGTVDFSHRHFTLLDAEINHSGLTYRIAMNSVKSTLLGDERGLDGKEMISLLVFNRGKGEFLEDSSGGASAGEGIFCHVDTLEGTLRHSWVPNGEGSEDNPVPPDWMNGTEIAFFTTEQCGYIDFPFEIKSIDLKH